MRTETRGSAFPWPAAPSVNPISTSILMDCTIDLPTATTTDIQSTVRVALTHTISQAPVLPKPLATTSKVDIATVYPSLLYSTSKALLASTSSAPQLLLPSSSPSTFLISPVLPSLLQISSPPHNSATSTLPSFALLSPSPTPTLDSPLGLGAIAGL
jgi:hypothetical protein